MNAKNELPAKWDMEVDLVSVGSSSGGLTAAIIGNELGLSTLVLEKAQYLGGGTALSGGVLWIPFNPIMLAEGISDSREEALQHIRHTSMGRHDEDLLAAYLDTGPEVISFFESKTPLKLTIESSTDYYAEQPGGKPRGRQLYPDPEVMIPRLTEAAEKHPTVAKVRPDPVPFFVNPREFWAEGRGIIGGLVLACVERGIEVLTEVPGKKLIVDQGRVVGIQAERDGNDFFVKARKGVLLATGGFEWHDQMTRRYINGGGLFPMTPVSNEGDGHIMAAEVGAAMALMEHAIFQPLFRIEGDIVDGKPFARGVPYALPGSILVNRHGERCCSETFYPDIGRALVQYDKLNSEMAHAPLYWIAHQPTAKIAELMATILPSADWLHKADTLAELATKVGMEAETLVATVDRFNEFARQGHDPDFNRGNTIYQRYFGNRFSPIDTPTPSLAPLEEGPFFAVQLHAGSVGTLGGVVTNADAQVISARGEVIPGLYGTSNTTALLTHGMTYTSGACQAKSTIFGYLAAKHAAGNSAQ